METKPVKRESLEEKLRRQIGEAILLQLLRRFSAEDLHRGYRNGESWAELFDTQAEGPGLLETIRNVAKAFPDPWVYGAVKYAKDRQRIEEFLDNAVQHRRPDLYALVAYSPGAREYIIRNIREVVEKVFW